MSLSLLFVDDDPLAREAAAAHLADEVFCVATVKDGAEACALMNQRRFDLVVLDLTMPKFDGLDVLRYVRSHEGHREIPVMVLTGRTDEEALFGALAEGASFFSVKPVDWKLLRLQLRFLVRDQLPSCATAPPMAESA
jgi:DNA-binding response OmpR family regulator